MAAIRGMLFLGQYQYDRYRANPTAIQMDKNYRDWIGIMPGLTFCFHDRLDWNRAWEYLERNQLTGHEATREGLAANETTGTYRRYLADFVQTLVGVTATELGNLSHFLTDSRLATGVNILELISTVGLDLAVLGLHAPQHYSPAPPCFLCQQVHPNHDIAINSFQPEHGARLQVHQIVTERGICYALNAPLALLQGVNGTSGQVASGKGFPGWSPIECEFSQHECYMKLDMFRSTVSYTIHSPYEVSTSDQLFTHVEESDELVAVYSVLETVANERLKDLTVRQRKCYFYDEAYENLQFYSYNLCIMNCRARRALAVCQCRPHFYPFAEGPACTVAGLHCLQQHPDWSSDADCKCLKSCTDVGYYVASLSKTQWYVVRLRAEMSRTGKVSFFLTEAGRQVVFYGATTVAIGLFAGHYFPHSICISYYKEFVQAYKNGEERKLSEKLEQRYKRALSLLDLSEFERKFAKPFVVYGFDVFNAGSFKTRYGAYVGIPSNFEYDSAAAIDRTDIKIRNQPIDWGTEAGRLLEDALVLTEDEQVFGIARELLTMKTHKSLIQSIIPTVSWMFTYSLASQLNERCNFYGRPRSLRLILYTICGLFGFGIYSFSTDMTEIYYETDVDKQMAALGPDVVDAGARFYDKVLKKNIAIRKLTGEDYYTAKGNVNYMLRQKAAPLTLRKEFFQTGYKDYVGTEETS
uniref:Uncharacterized protein n=1 Tax=Anopheles merus TaxID=30066 RepID=A0A182UT28_ANOME